jgi:beta-lactamase class A
MNTGNALPHYQRSIMLHRLWRVLLMSFSASMPLMLITTGCISQSPVEQNRTEMSSWQPSVITTITPSASVASVQMQVSATSLPVATDIPAPPTRIPTVTVVQDSPTPGISPSPVPAENELPPFPEQEVVNILNNVPGTFGLIVYDESLAQEVYEWQADTSFYAASLIKLPIALTLYTMAHQDEIDLNEQLTMQQTDIVPGAGSLQYGTVGTSYTLRELCVKMISESDNTASNMLLTRIGFDRVNSLMQQLGARQTFVERLFFDEEARLAGRDIRTSPRDMALLLRILLSGELTGQEGASELMSTMQQTTDHQKIPALLPPDVTVMNKSGVIPGVEHDVGIVSLPNGHRYIVVIMSAELVDNNTGINAIAQISQIIFSYEQALDL